LIVVDSSAIVAIMQLEPPAAELRNRVAREFAPIDEVQARVALEARIQYGRGFGHRAHLNYSDCFAYALAKVRDLPLLFVGDDFTHTDIVSALA
jgi:ribonuclease VapC